MHRSRAFRPDVEGLRAVAVLAVVLYHAHVGVLGGGYVGVDIFFVLSGFLITGLLWRELEKRGRLSFTNFYARRARRLLPASILVVVVTVLAASRWLSPLEAASVTKDGIASALYVPNFRFALLGTNYLTATSAPSPLQHYWSLGVEEQFYLLWPVLLLLASLAWRRSRQISRPAATAGLTVIGLASFALSVWLTGFSQPWAFFSLPTRAWELVAGGLIALTAPQLRRLPAGVAAALGWLGLAGILWSITQISATTAFPGWAALAPVGATVAVLVAGSANPGLGPILVLGLKPFQVIGKLSYSWYLWHWPVLVLAPAVLGHQLALWQNLALAAFSGILAMITVVFVELPVRFSPWVTSKPGRGLAIGASLSGVAVISAVLIGGSLPALQGHGLAPVALAARTSAAGSLSAGAAGGTSGTGVTGGTGGTTSTTLDPLAAAVASATAPIVAAVAQSVTTQNVPANLDPPLARALRDEARPFLDGCLNSFTDAVAHHCVYASANSATTVMLFGDSHAAQWFPALDLVANTRGWRLVVQTKATCPPVIISIFSPVLGRPFRECDSWRNQVLARIRAERPAVVVLGIARHYSNLYHFDMYGPQWIQDMAATVSAIRQMGSHVVVLGPIPKPAVNVPDCLSTHLTHAVACTQVLAQVVNSQGLAAEQAAVVGAGGTYIDPIPWLCTATTCDVIIDNLLVFRDDNHLTTTYTTWVAPLLGAELDQSLHRA